MGHKHELIMTWAWNIFGNFKHPLLLFPLTDKLPQISNCPAYTEIETTSFSVEVVSSSILNFSPFSVKPGHAKMSEVPDPSSATFRRKHIMTLTCVTAHAQGYIFLCVE